MVGGCGEDLCGVKVGGFGGAWEPSFGGSLLFEFWSAVAEVWICERGGAWGEVGSRGARPRSLSRSAAHFATLARQSSLYYTTHYTTFYTTFYTTHARAAREIFPPLHPFPSFFNTFLSQNLPSPTSILQSFQLPTYIYTYIYTYLYHTIPHHTIPHQDHVSYHHADAMCHTILTPCVLLC